MLGLLRKMFSLSDCLEIFLVAEGLLTFNVKLAYSELGLQMQSFNPRMGKFEVKPLLYQITSRFFGFKILYHNY